MQWATSHYRDVELAPIGSFWHPIRQIWELIRSDFSTYWLGGQNVLKSDFKKSRICPIWDQSDLFWVQIWPPWCSNSLRHYHVLTQYEHNYNHLNRVCLLFLFNVIITNKNKASIQLIERTHCSCLQGNVQKKTR